MLDSICTVAHKPSVIHNARTLKLEWNVGNLHIHISLRCYRNEAGDLSKERALPKRGGTQRPFEEHEPLLDLGVALYHPHPPVRVRRAEETA